MFEASHLLKSALTSANQEFGWLQNYRTIYAHRVRHIIQFSLFLFRNYFVRLRAEDKLAAIFFFSGVHNGTSRNFPFLYIRRYQLIGLNRKKNVYLTENTSHHRPGGRI